MELRNPHPKCDKFWRIILHPLPPPQMPHPLCKKVIQCQMSMVICNSSSHVIKECPAGSATLKITEPEIPPPNTIYMKGKGCYPSIQQMAMIQTKFLHPAMTLIWTKPMTPIEL